MTTQYYPMFQDKQNGVYLILTVHASAPCAGNTSDTVHITFDLCTGIDKITSREMIIRIQPNPSNGVVNLSIENLAQTAELNITDLEGRVVFRQNYLNPGPVLNDQLNLTSLPKGTYILKVNTETRNKIEKLVIQ